MAGILEFGGRWAPPIVSIYLHSIQSIGSAFDSGRNVTVHGVEKGPACATNSLAIAIDTIREMKGYALYRQ